MIIPSKMQSSSISIVVGETNRNSKRNSEDSRTSLNSQSNLTNADHNQKKQKRIGMNSIELIFLLLSFTFDTFGIIKSIYCYD